MNAFLDYLDATVPEHSEGNLTAVPALVGGNFQSGEPIHHSIASTAQLVTQCSQCRPEDVWLSERYQFSILRAHTRSNRLCGRLTWSRGEQIEIQGSLQRHTHHCGEQAWQCTHQPSSVRRSRSRSDNKYHGCSCGVANGIYSRSDTVKFRSLQRSCDRTLKKLRARSLNLCSVANKIRTV